MPRLSIAAVLVLLFVLPASARAQASGFQLEARVGAAVPHSDFADFGLGGGARTGASFGMHFSLANGPIDFRVGFSEHRFGCGAACEGEVVSTGWDLGIRWNLIPGRSVVPWLQANTTAHIAQADFGDLTSSFSPPPSVEVESDRGWGWSAGAGVFLRVSERFGFNPGVRYTRVTPAFDSRFGDMESRFWVADVGLVLGF